MSDAAGSFDKGMDNLRGRILGLIESFGLPDRQEKAAKATFKTLTYDLQEKIHEDIKHELKGL